MSKVAIGRIQKSYGLKGYLRVHSFSGESEHFTKLNEIYIKQKDRFLRYSVESVLIGARRILIRLEGIDTPERAKALTGSEIWVEREFAAPLQKGQYYETDLCGCDVYQGGRRLGKARSVLSGGGMDILEVEPDKGRPLLIPFADHFIGDIDIGKKKIYLKEEYVVD